MVKEKYNYRLGTHCWYCDREFTGIRPLVRTREHVVPKFHGTLASNIKNYVAACEDCNRLKANRNARQFANHLKYMLYHSDCTGYPNYKFFDLMIYRAWKIYNKTSKMHKMVNRNT